MKRLLESHAAGTTVLRLLIGVIFIAHGALKAFSFGLAGTTGFLESIGVPLARVMAPVLIATELGGGILLVLGLLTRYVSLPLLLTMIVAIATVHLQHGFFLPDGYEFALLVGGGLVTLLLQGPGALALDNVLGRERHAVEPVELRRAA
jgi:putative oxidoreductase